MLSFYWTPSRTTTKVCYLYLFLYEKYKKGREILYYLIFAKNFFWFQSEEREKKKKKKSKDKEKERDKSEKSEKKRKRSHQKSRDENRERDELEQFLNGSVTRVNVDMAYEAI